MHKANRSNWTLRSFCRVKLACPDEAGDEEQEEKDEKR